jgi:uncharacterized protein YndB with AHSA1/START domain
MSADDSKTPHAVTLTRTYAAAPEKVWRAWTDPKAMMRWMRPAPGFTASVVESDLRVGGRYRIILKGPAGEELETVGVFREVIPNRKLVYTWTSPNAPDQETVVTVTLTPSGAGTLFELRHDGFPGTKTRDSHTAGWSSSLASLDAYLSA